jgi:hypothetical protein
MSMKWMRHVFVVAALSPCLVLAQELPGVRKPMVDANPSFDVATIRPSRPGDERPPIIQIQNRRWFAINRTVMELIT